MEPLLRVQDLTVCYGAPKQRMVRALGGISFELKAGEALGVLGESGSGKTTLALALLRLLPKTMVTQSGTALFRGINLFELNEGELRKIRGARISLVQQEPASVLNPVLHVGDQVAEVVRAHQEVSGRRAREISKQLLAQVGLGGDSQIEAAFPHQLSGGQRQRVLIAQAIACGPDLIIADEPTTALDPVVQLQILALLRELQAKLKLGLLLITHDPAVLMSTAQRILVMYAGRIVEEGPAKELLGHPAHPFTRALLQCRPVTLWEDRLRRLPTIPGEPPDLAALPTGCAFAPRCPDRMDTCDSRSPREVHQDSARRVWCHKYEQ